MEVCSEFWICWIEKQNVDETETSLEAVVVAMRV